eukprot:jgi/Undpi1/12623/HiC_scaffold_6.g02291.m1
MASQAGRGSGSDAEGPVDTRNWSLYGRAEVGRPTPFLVGPIVGAVTETTGRVLVEMEKSMVVKMDAFMDGAKVCSVKQRVAGKTPTCFQLKNFRPGKRIRVSVNVGEFGQEREARFTTTSSKSLWKIASVSCNCHTHTEELGLWDRLAGSIGEVDCVLHMGDQIYADEDFGAKSGGSMHFESSWQACLTKMEGVDRSGWDNIRPALLECYRKTYRNFMSERMHSPRKKVQGFAVLAGVVTVLASAANYMICDDHEFVDDLGDEPEHRDPSTPEFYVARVGYQVYCEYQKQLLVDLDVTNHSVRPYYAFRLSPKVGFFMTDNRIERSIHRLEGTDEEWKNQDFLGPRQWERLKQAFAKDFAGCETVLFGAPTPLVFISQAATGVAERVIDDARGTWGHKNFKIEQEALTTFLSNWQSAKPNRAVVTLAGDVHIGGFTDSWHNNAAVPLHQMTASAVGNTPERDIDKLKEVLMRSVMHADERLFSFKVRHHDWIFGPNFGMVDIQLNGTRRPDISLTLIPHVGDPKIRNLELGNSGIKVKNPQQSDASRSAYQTAMALGVDPRGGAPAGGTESPSNPTPGCNGPQFLHKSKQSGKVEE